MSVSARTKFSTVTDGACVVDVELGMESSPRRASWRGPDHAAESQVAGRCVHCLRHARGRAVALAVVRRAEVGAALHHPAWNADAGRAGVEALLGIASPRVVERAA